MRVRTKEARALARYVDSLAPDARAYALDMVYRVIGEPIPPESPGDDVPPRDVGAKVIQLFPSPGDDA